MYLAPEEVAVVSRQLKGISTDTFAALIDAKAMLAADIYPIQQSETDEDVRAFLSPAFETLKSFYADAVAQGMAVVAVMR